MPRTRQLAAIMFTDIKGYTALMQQNEAEAIAVREKHREIFNSSTEKHRGKILQYYGDGTLSIFDSAIDAVNCGIDMQLGFQTSPIIPVRIGIHTGDIIFDQEEIIGDSVNIASRIESLAIPGSVLVSDKVYDEIKNQESIHTHFLKQVLLKNIRKPIDIYAIVNEGLILPDANALKGKTEPLPSPTKSQASNPTQAQEVTLDNILSTKLYIPPIRPQAISRSRLIESLSRGLSGKLTLVSAPAGFGKTSLVSEWLAKLDHPTAWLSLDSADQELGRFLRYFIAALRRISPNIGSKSLIMLERPKLPPLETLLTSLLNDLAGIGETFLLVLDDYHLIDHKVIDDALSFILDHQPPHMHLVITTREDPHLPLARLRVRGQLTEIRAQELRFTSSEAADFLNKGMGLTLSTDNVTALESRTEGWIAGLQMAAISLQRQSDTSRFIQDFTGSHRFVLDYLVEEVIESQVATVRSFLLSCAILDKLYAPLCNAVVQGSSARHILENLERSNLFIIPLDNQRKWYRFHHLFAEVLQAYAREHSPTELSILHQRASAWYEEHDFREDAIRHALQAQDFEQAASLIELRWPAMDQHFQAKTWLIWAKKLPESLVISRPVLCVAYAWAYLNEGKMEEGKKYLHYAEKGFKMGANKQDAPLLNPESQVADTKEFRYLPASIATARSYIMQALGDIPGSVEQIQHALSLLPEEAYLRKGPATSLLAITYWTQGDLPQAYSTLDAAMGYFRRVENLSFALSGTFGLADIKVALGELREAENIYTRALQQVEKHKDRVVRGISDFHLGLAKIACEQGKLTDAKIHLQKSIDLGEQKALPDWPCRLCLTQAKIAQAEGNLSQALLYLDKAEELYYRTPLPNLRPIPALKAEIWLRQNDLSQALSWLRKTEEISPDTIDYLHEFEYLTRIRIHTALYMQRHAAESLQKEMANLAPFLTLAESTQRNGSLIEIYVVQALAYEALGDRELALDSLGEAIIRAEPEGYARIFLNEGENMLQLLAEIDTKSPNYSYAKKLRLLGGRDALKRNQALTEPLSDRELEVLSLIAGGNSNKEISEQLFLSLSTIKGHNQHIFEKLGVKRRTEAVARARELGIL